MLVYICQIESFICINLVCFSGGWKRDIGANRVVTSWKAFLLWYKALMFQVIRCNSDTNKFRPCIKEMNILLYGQSFPVKLHFIITLNVHICSKTTETWSLAKQWPIKSQMIYWVNRARMFKHQERTSEKNSLQAG